MKNTDIHYNLSTDYNRLYDLLCKEITVIGFVPESKAESRITTISYNKEDNCFLFKGSKTFWYYNEFCKKLFSDFCKDYNIRFFDVYPQTSRKDLLLYANHLKNELLRVTEILNKLDSQIPSKYPESKCGNYNC